IFFRSYLIISCWCPVGAGGQSRLIKKRARFKPFTYCFFGEYVMNTIDLTPLYRNSTGFDRLASLLDNALRTDVAPGYPPYNIEMLGENRYSITLAVAG